MKKKILFVIDSLGCAGAEKSLVTLLSLIDSTKYQIDLQLFSYGGELEEFIPKHVNILPELGYFKDTKCNLCSHLLSFKLKTLLFRLLFSIRIRKSNLKHADRARIFWTLTRNIIKPIKNTEYDIAIAYGHNIPTFYVAENIVAKKKFAWVNVDLKLSEPNLNYQYQFYKKFTNITCVSESSYNQFCRLYPSLKDSAKIIYDIIDSSFIKQLSEVVSPKDIVQDNTFKILTVARLNYYQKGYDVSLEACKIIKERGLNFKWYALGTGEYRTQMIDYIKENELDNYFELLGTRSNPYPYFRACDLYVQTSRHEGFGLSIAEARILNKPVVTTEFDAVWNQMVQGKNGIVVPIDAIAVADAIQDLIEHPEKMAAISDYQQTEKKGNIEELEKFYQLIES